MTEIQLKPGSGLSDSSLSEILADSELREQIEKLSAPILKRAGEILFRQGEGPGYALFVKAGEIGLTMNVSGGAVWGARAKKGSLVGLPAVVGNEPYSMTARAILDSQICQISRDDFQRLMHQNPRFCCNVLQILAAEVHAARKAVSTLLLGLS
jgi:CRP-like cAMP-binding protein